ncbi:hypothetical protein ACO0QE_000324 [Hanseniaspora vineae]
MSRRKIGGASAPKKKAAGSNGVSSSMATAIIGTPKENAQLAEAVKLYEGKHYKKSIKAVDAILKKNSSHFDSLSLKALNLFFINDKDQAESYAKKAINKINGNTSLCTHTGCFILGLYYKQTKDYAESAKWYQLSLDNGSPNKHSHRELAVLYAHLRNFDGAVKERTNYLQAMMGYRANWTGLALALDLAGKPDQAAKYLANFEDLAKGKLGPGEMYENNECIAYKNDLYYKMAGNDPEKLQNVLKDLDTIENDVYDKYALLERRASIYMQLGDVKNASRVYRKLIKRNPDNFKYYKLLEVSLGVADSPSLRLALYEKMQEFYPRSEPPKYMPLTFVQDSKKLEECLSAYILPQLKRGVLATFSNIKPLYRKRSNTVPKLVESIVESFLQTHADSTKTPDVYIWTLYFLAQHYLYTKNFVKAQDYINKAIEHTPTAIELYIVKARILKHLGLLDKAAGVIEEARELDLQDRYINNKSVKYQLRCNDVHEAVQLISLFTKNDDESFNGIKDLHTLEAGWFLVEQAESYYRLYLSTKKQILEKLRSAPEIEVTDESFDELKYDMTKYKGLALKRFAAISKIYDNFNDDQYDFHSYCPRKGTARSYLDLVSWGDRLYTLPIFVRAMKGFSKIALDDESQDEKLIFPETAGKNTNSKKKAKKFLKQKQADDEIEVASEKKDQDPLGEKLLHAKSPVHQFLDIFYDKYSKQVLAEDKDEMLEFMVNFRLGKFAICVSAMNKILHRKTTKSNRALVGAMCMMLVVVLETQSETLDPISKAVLQRSLTEQFKFSRDLLLSSDAATSAPQEAQSTQDKLDWFAYLQKIFGISSESLLLLYRFFSEQDDVIGERYIFVDELKPHILDSIKSEDPIEQSNVLNYEL